MKLKDVLRATRRTYIRITMLEENKYSGDKLRVLFDELRPENPHPIRDFYERYGDWEVLFLESDVRIMDETPIPILTIELVNDFPDD